MTTFADDEQSKETLVSAQFSEKILVKVPTKPDLEYLAENDARAIVRMLADVGGKDLNIVAMKRQLKAGQQPHPQL